MSNRISTRTRVAAAALASTMLIAGCADSGGEGEGETDNEGTPSSLSKDEIYVDGYVGDQPEAEPAPGGTLTIADYAEPRSLDPTVTIPSGAVGGSAMAAVYDTLMKYDDVNDEFVPQLAESLETDDNTTWTLTLREGVTFADGTPVNSAAVLGSMGYYMENFGFQTLVLASSIKDMKPVDERTIEFTLNSPFPTFPNLLAGGFGMVLAPAAIKNGQEGFKPIGAGAFELKSYKPAEELVLTARDDYWDGRPNLDELRFVWLGADDAKMDALEGGSVDVANVRAPQVVEDARQEGWAGIMSPNGLGSMLWINSREGRAGEDPRLREAINLAIDPEVYLERGSGGAGMPSRSIYSPAMNYYEEIETVEHDPERAKELVEEAKADGANTKLVYIGQSDPASQNGAVAIEAMLEAVGFDVELDLLNDVTEQTRRIYMTFEYDLAVASMSLTEFPYAGLYTSLNSQSPQNPTGFGSEGMDAALAELQGADGEDRVAALTAVNEQWQEDLPGVSLAAGAFFLPWQDNVHGVEASVDQLMLFDDAFKTE